MAKRKVLPDDYNPVRSALLGLKEVEHSAVQDRATNELVVIQKMETGIGCDSESMDSNDTPSQLTEPNVHNERKDCQLRVRCSRAERKRWNDFAYNITGESNRFSHLFRALLLLAERAEPGLLSQVAQIRALPLPQKSDPLAVAHYEERLSRVLWEGVRRSAKL